MDTKLSSVFLWVHLPVAIQRASLLNRVRYIFSYTPYLVDWYGISTRVIQAKYC